MSTFAQTDESLMAANEPTEPLAYVLSALAACIEGKKALETRDEEMKVWDVRFFIFVVLLIIPLIPPKPPTSVA